MPKLVKMIAILFFVFAGLFIITSFIEGEWCGGIIAIPMIVFGIALLKGQNWARVWLIMLLVLDAILFASSMFHFPSGDMLYFPLSDIPIDGFLSNWIFIFPLFLFIFLSLHAILIYYFCRADVEQVFISKKLEDRFDQEEVDEEKTFDEEFYDNPYQSINKLLDKRLGGFLDKVKSKKLGDGSNQKEEDEEKTFNEEFYDSPHQSINKLLNKRTEGFLDKAKSPKLGGRFDREEGDEEKTFDYDNPYQSINKLLDKRLGGFLDKVKSRELEDGFERKEGTTRYKKFERLKKMRERKLAFSGLISMFFLIPLGSFFGLKMNWILYMLLLGITTLVLNRMIVWAGYLEESIIFQSMPMRKITKKDTIKHLIKMSMIGIPIAVVFAFEYSLYTQNVSHFWAYYIPGFLACWVSSPTLITIPLAIGLYSWGIFTWGI